mmetsp:Transcript_33227/g.92548  ORF Transcript_33227/g.92548 Transcript_33227/m.92548 type:complete len:300 (-) Transcript_33227:85-984(-)
MGVRARGGTRGGRADHALALRAFLRAPGAGAAGRAQHRGDAAHRRGDLQPAARPGARLPRLLGGRARLPGGAEQLPRRARGEPHAGGRVPRGGLLPLPDPPPRVHQLRAADGHRGGLLPGEGVQAVPDPVGDAEDRPAHRRRRADLVAAARVPQREGQRDGGRGLGPLRRRQHRGGRFDVDEALAESRQLAPAHVLGRHAALEPVRAAAPVAEGDEGPLAAHERRVLALGGHGLRRRAPRRLAAHLRGGIQHVEQDVLPPAADLVEEPRPVRRLGAGQRGHVARDPGSCRCRRQKRHAC